MADPRLSQQIAFPEGTGMSTVTQVRGGLGLCAAADVREPEGCWIGRIRSGHPHQLTIPAITTDLDTSHSVGLEGRWTPRRSGGFGFRSGNEVSGGGRWVMRPGMIVTPTLTFAVVGDG